MTATIFADAPAPSAKSRLEGSLWLVPALALFAIQFGEILKLHGALFDAIVDPDTLMRLARIKYALAGHGWQGGAFPRDNAPYGMVLHWSLLFDLPIVALAGILSLAMPFGAALSVAGALTGPVLAYAVLWAAWWLPRPVLSPRGRELSCLVVLLSPPILAYGAVGRANHHVAMALMALIVSGLVLRIWVEPKRLGAALAGGVAAAISAWLSFELVAIAIVPALVVLGLLWIRDGGPRLRQNQAFATAFAIGAAAALAIDPPHGGFATFLLDRLSAPYVGFAWSVAAMWALLGFAAQGGWRARLVWTMAVGTLAAATLVAAYPDILAGVNGQIDPVVRGELNAKVQETQPAWTSLRQFLQFAYVGCLGAAAAALRAWRSRGTPAGFTWALLTVLASAMAGLGLAHIRFTPYSYLAAAFLLAALVEQGQAAWTGAAGRYLRTFVLVAGLGVPFLAGFLPDGSGNGGAAAEARDPCSVYAVRRPLSDPAWYGAAVGIVASDVDSAPALLYWTPHGTLFGPYHRNGQGLRDLLTLFRDTGDTAARGIVKARGIDGFLVCAADPAGMFMTPDGKAASAGVARGDTLFKRLVEGRPPAWLRRQAWPDGLKSGYAFYRVDRTRLDGGLD